MKGTWASRDQAAARHQPSSAWRARLHEQAGAH